MDKPNEMEERVARAIYETAPETNMGEPVPWEKLTDYARIAPLEAARAALAAIATALKELAE